MNLRWSFCQYYHVGGRTRGTNELEVPGSCARRSALIADLREQLDDDEVIVPLPLSLNEIQAWISYVEGQGRADSGPFSWRHCIELEDADRDAPDHDATLVRALKVGYRRAISCFCELYMQYIVLSVLWAGLAHQCDSTHTSA